MATIWFKPFTVEQLNLSAKNTLLESLGIELTRMGPDFLEGRMPVDRRTHQVYGILHGGASVALAETLGSVSAQLCVDPDRFQCFGLEINANHLRPVQSGFVVGRAAPIHLGKTTQVWEIRIRKEDSEDRLICISRITMVVREKAPSAG